MTHRMLKRAEKVEECKKQLEESLADKEKSIFMCLVGLFVALFAMVIGMIQVEVVPRDDLLDSGGGRVPTRI